MNRKLYDFQKIRIIFTVRNMNNIIGIFTQPCNTSGTFWYILLMHAMADLKSANKDKISFR